jgi:hypothetical protein
MVKQCGRRGAEGSSPSAYASGKENDLQRAHHLIDDKLYNLYISICDQTEMHEDIRER